MSADEPPGPSGVVADTEKILDEVKPEGAEDTPPDSRKEREDRFSGLRDLAKQKESWSRWLRAILIIAFVLQVGVIGVALFVGEGVDVWTTRGLLLQFTAMFIAALRYLFK